MKPRIAQRGDIYWLDPNPIVGREMQNRHRFVVITVKEINALGMVNNGTDYQWRQFCMP
jgi:mRNA interferase ChpB